jgi:hypothetical protein
MGCERFLLVCRPLHGSQRRLQIGPNPPLMHSIRSGEAHRFESHQPGCHGLLANCSEPTYTRTPGVRRDRVVTGDSVERLSSAQNQSVQRREALQRDLPSKRDGGILFRSITELHGCEMLRHGPQTILDVFPIKLEFLTTGIETSERDVDVGMLRVEVRHRHPFERHMEIGLDTGHNVSRDPLQVETVTELRGDDQLPQPWIAGLLPFKKLRWDIDASSFRGEPSLVGLE